MMWSSVVRDQRMRTSQFPLEDSRMAELVPLFFIVMYIVPFCIAVVRAHHNAGAIFVVNCLLGWTVIGWIATFAWAAFGPAATTRSRAADAARYQASTTGGSAPMPRILYNFID
jgi:hypothetical protein